MECTAAVQILASSLFQAYRFEVPEVFVFPAIIYLPPKLQTFIYSHINKKRHSHITAMHRIRARSPPCDYDGEPGTMRRSSHDSDRSVLSRAHERRPAHDPYQSSTETSNTHAALSVSVVRRSTRRGNNRTFFVDEDGDEHCIQIFGQGHVVSFSGQGNNITISMDENPFNYTNPEESVSWSASGHRTHMASEVTRYRRSSLTAMGPPVFNNSQSQSHEADLSEAQGSRRCSCTSAQSSSVSHVADSIEDSLTEENAAERSSASIGFVCGICHSSFPTEPAQKRPRKWWERLYRPKSFTQSTQSQSEEYIWES